MDRTRLSLDIQREHCSTISKTLNFFYEENFGKKTLLLTYLSARVTSRRPARKNSDTSCC